MRIAIILLAISALVVAVTALLVGYTGSSFPELYAPAYVPVPASELATLSSDALARATLYAQDQHSQAVASWRASAARSFQALFVLATVAILQSVALLAFCIRGKHATEA